MVPGSSSVSSAATSVSAAPTGLEWAHPLVQEWFIGRFGTPTEPQLLGWPPILARHDTLISAPTGSGKTLAAFLACIDNLVRKAAEGSLPDHTAVVYVSPLKALSNDVHKNLEIPLSEIAALARVKSIPMREIRTAVRTGDTLAHARRAMLQHPPHILVTTPESLYILLTADRSREILRNVDTVIVDEIHAMADDKRGAHMALTLERLEVLARSDATTDVSHRRLVRIGLSATQKPIEVVAEFLSGHGRRLPTIVQVSSARRLDLGVEVPSSELGPVASNELWTEIYDRIATLVGAHRSTLVFVNTRRLSERVALHLAERLGADVVAAHHGSLSRKLRLDAERRLKAGELKALVATASLELGIDVGSVDLVCHISSPRSIAVAVQRIGRAGHWRGAIPKGRIFPTTLDELVECAALVLAMRRGELDRIVVPDTPLDVLAQQIVAMCAVESWREADLFDVITRAYPYRHLTRAEFDEIVAMLSEGIAGRRGRAAAFLHHDQVNGELRGRRGAKLTAITNGGAIPDNGLYTVVAEPEGTVIGSVDEDFAVESLAGDVMLLGNASWRIRRVSIAGRVLVEDAHGAAPTIPFWRGEAPGRTVELSTLVGEVRGEVDARSTDVVPENIGLQPAAESAVAWLMQECAVDRSGAEQIVDYVVTGRTVLGAVPSTRTLIAERFFDEGGGMQLVIHAPFGARINKAWGLALRKKFCRSFNFELQAAATDNGITIALAEQHSFPLADVFAYLRPATTRETLEQAALPSPIFGTRWRWDASRALALPRFRGGKKVPIHVQRLLSDDLLASVFPDVAACQENIEGDIQIPNHPLVREVMKDVLHEAMDLPGLLAVLEGIGDGSIRTIAVDTPVPSVFSHEILNANPYAFLDDAPLEERRARAVELRRVLPDAVVREVGGLDPAAIDEVRQDAWPDVRSADELHDTLLTLVAFPEHDAARETPTSDESGNGQSALAMRARTATGDWRVWLAPLRAASRATRADVDGRMYWVAAERRHAFSLLFPSATFEEALPEIPRPDPTVTEASVQIVQGWMSHSGPTDISELSDVLGLPAEIVEEAMLRLESAGWALRGRFDSRSAAVIQWCERRSLARVHRLTLGILRREIAPVTAALFMRWLLDWQHVAPGTQLSGELGLATILQQLQGYEAAANAWEPQILTRRLRNYDPADLDRLCLGGAVGWGRLSPHPATLEGEDRSSRRVTPTSVAPVSFFVREEAGWLASRRQMRAVDVAPVLSPNARDVYDYLGKHGASFFTDLTRGTRHVQAEVEAALWELVAAGLVTADGFDNLRALIDPRRRAGRGEGRHQRPRQSTGRWAILPDFSGDDRVHALESACWMLLRRYGVVFRELLARESNLPPWRDLLLTLRRLEDRGDVRGGRFVSGFIGEQFALPVAVESLRAARHRAPSGDVLTVAAADPLNLVGVLVPGDRVASVSGRFVTYRDGVAVPAATSAA